LERKTLNNDDWMGSIACQLYDYLSIVGF